MKKILLAMIVLCNLAFAQVSPIAPAEESQFAKVVKMAKSTKYSNLSKLKFSKDGYNNSRLVDGMDSYYLYPLLNNTYALVFQSGASGSYSKILDVIMMSKKRVTFLDINSQIARDFNLKSPANSCVNWYCTLAQAPFLRDGSKVIVSYMAKNMGARCDFVMQNSTHLVSNSSDPFCKI